MKQKLIIVEGPQGTGKTTLTNYLRDNIASTNLYRLAGQKLKTMEGKNYSTQMYNALMNYLKQIEKVPMNLIFDRAFFSEEVYARLGYKEYSFTDIYEDLLKKLNNLNYDIYYISLYLENTDLYKQRLERDHHHNYQAFSIQSNINQQKEYQKLAEELKKYQNIQVISLAMDDFDKAYQKINKIFTIED